MPQLLIGTERFYARRGYSRTDKSAPLRLVSVSRVRYFFRRDHNSQNDQSTQSTPKESPVQLPGRSRFLETARPATRRSQQQVGEPRDSTTHCATRLRGRGDRLERPRVFARRPFDCLFDIHGNLPRLAAQFPTLVSSCTSPQLQPLPTRSRKRPHRSVREPARSDVPASSSRVGPRLVSGGVSIADACSLIGNYCTLSTYPAEVREKITPVTVSASWPCRSRARAITHHAKEVPLVCGRRMHPERP